jgi:hypothetical protein
MTTTTSEIYWKLLNLKVTGGERPLSREEQDECVRLNVRLEEIYSSVLAANPGRKLEKGSFCRVCGLPMLLPANGRGYASCAYPECGWLGKVFYE